MEIKINGDFLADADGWMVPAAAADTPPLVKVLGRSQEVLSALSFRRPANALPFRHFAIRALRRDLHFGAKPL